MTSTNRMHRTRVALACITVTCAIALPAASAAAADGVQGKQTVKAIYIPLADHYAAIVAFEKYRDQMKHADFQIERMKSWPLLRSYFMSGEVDMAFVMCPLAMDMFAEKQNFRWIGLMHRDGNAMAINDLVNAKVGLPPDRLNRKPDDKLANAFQELHAETGKTIHCAVPSLHATHTVVLYKYLKEHGLTLDLDSGAPTHVSAIAVAPPKAPSFLKKNNSRGIPASFEQSLPWADVVETKGFGHVAWYSKDVMPWNHGHVECITLATDVAIAEKNAAIKEVIHFIHQAGLDIEQARRDGSESMIAIADMVRKHIPEHNEAAIIQSLRIDLDVINYRHLNVDEPGLKQIMDLAVEGGILKAPINIEAFADHQFSTEITKQAPAIAVVDDE